MWEILSKALSKSVQNNFDKLFMVHSFSPTIKTRQELC